MFPPGTGDMSNVNLKQLAKALNLAPSTVSRALRDSHEISQETKDRVKKLAAELGFEPNPYASSLRQSKSKTIAVIVPEIENNFFSQAMNGIEKIAQSKGYHVLIYITHEDFNREKSILQLLRNGRVDGILISVSNTTHQFEHIDEYVRAGVPLVSFDRVYEALEVPSVTTDDIYAARKATEHLLAAGCKRIAFLSLAESLSISSRRRTGYLDALKKKGLSGEEITVECSDDDEKNRVLIRNLLQKKQKPDAIFAAAEKLAINAYEVCHELKIPVPGKIKMISFSNSPATALFDPPLSTIVQPAHEIGQEAASALFKLIEKKILLPAERNQVLPSFIIERRSSHK
jgi:LacI family transcriptional regulator